MFKHRDNVRYAPTTLDPNGNGFTVQPETVGNQPPLSLIDEAVSAAPTGGAAVVAAGSRKRRRDIRGIDRFRQVVYGENGFPRLHAMVTRNPMLMYPPEGIAAARARMAQRAREHPPPADGEDDALWDLFEQRKRAETEAEAGLLPSTSDAVAAPTTPPSSLVDEELAQYHHKQLDAFLKLVYEFNHTTFVKLPMADTVQLLSRCGREAVAHVMEYEMHLRMQREGRLKELRTLHEEEEKLKKRRLDVELLLQSHELEVAEQRQRALEDVANPLCTDEGEAQDALGDTVYGSTWLDHLTRDEEEGKGNEGHTVAESAARQEDENDVHDSVGKDGEEGLRDDDGGAADDDEVLVVDAVVNKGEADRMSDDGEEDTVAPVHATEVVVDTLEVSETAMEAPVVVAAAEEVVSASLVPQPSPSSPARRAVQFIDAMDAGDDDGSDAKS